MPMPIQMNLNIPCMATIPQMQQIPKSDFTKNPIHHESS